MKKISNYMMTALLGVTMLLNVSCDQKAKGTELPEAATAFLNEYFPNEQIRKIDKEGSKYEVKMQSDAEFDFDRNGEWTKVNCRKEPVPAEVLPTPILQYVEANYPGVFVTEIEMIGSKYEVDLSNGLDMFFTKDGEFVKIEK